MTWRPSRISPSRWALVIPSTERSPPWHVLLHRVFPMPAVEEFRLERAEVDVVETARVGVDLVRIGERHVERMNTADFAERVLGDAGVERVRREIVLAADELELLRRHDQMQEA